MKSEKWFADRKIAEGLLRTLGKVTPAALKTLQDQELERIIIVLAEVTGACGRERSERPTRKKGRGR